MSTYVVAISVTEVGAPLQPSGVAQPTLFASEPWDTEDINDKELFAILGRLCGRLFHLASDVKEHGPPFQYFCCARHAFIYGYQRGLSLATLDPLTSMLSAKTQLQIEQAITKQAETLADRFGLVHPEVVPPK